MRAQGPRTRRSYPSQILRLALCTALALSLALPAGAAGAPPVRTSQLVEVVVELGGAPARGRTLAARRERERSLAALQRRLELRIADAIPDARVRWRYRLVLNAIAVVVPRSELTRLARLPGVARVHRPVVYRSTLDASPAVIGAPALWGTPLAHGGRGVKIGIIDDGIDPRSRFFRPAGLEMPAGFPKGNARFTSAKIIVARSFPRPDDESRAAKLPFDARRSEHGTHVAGIAAGTAGTVVRERAGRPRVELSGVAPLAYLGNYRALTIDTVTGVGLNGNSPEIVAAVEAAVRDGMDVINLSLGQPEIAPERDIVAKALDNAAALGVVPVVAAGNDFAELGNGSVASPGSAGSAITVAAVTGGRAFGVAVRVTEAGAPAEVARFAAAPLASTRERSAGAATAIVAAAVADPALCTRAGVPAGAAGALVLTAAGACSIERKAARARAGGAAGVLLVSDHVARLLTAVLELDVPVLAVPRAQGDALGAYLAARGGRAAATVTTRPAVLASGGAGALASFSAGGPTPLGLLLKPDVAAPGVDVYSALPTSAGRFGLWSGTSMAAPHVSGAVALLRERHPDWTVQQLKSALVTTGRPVALRQAIARPGPVTRAGGGLVDLVAADQPLLFASPQSLSFGLVDASRSGTVAAAVRLLDAGGGAGTWSVTVAPQTSPAGVDVTVPETVDVPGELPVTVTVGSNALDGDAMGFVVLERDGVSRHLPYWLGVTRPALRRQPPTRLARTGTYEGDTRGRAALVDRYRYPEPPGLPALRGPEQAFRIRITRPVANIGAAIVRHDPRVHVTPRLVVGADENRLAGASALPSAGNPYLESFGTARPVVSVLRPKPGAYTLVFDSRDRAGAGRFSFRLWIDDTTPPTVRLPTAIVRGGVLAVQIADAGAGVDPASLVYRLEDGPFLPVDRWSAVRGEATLELSDVDPGTYRLVVRASDYQESKNTENTGRFLPNTRFLEATIVVPA